MDAVFGPLNVRVQEEAAVVKTEELRKKKEREETARKMKEERLRRLEEEKQEQSGVAALHQPNALAALPNQIESPGGKVSFSAGGAPPPMMEATSAAPAAGGPLLDFSDLQRPDQGADISAGLGTSGRAGQSRMALHAAPAGTPPRPPAPRRDSLGRGDPAESSHASMELGGSAATAQQQRPSSASRPNSADNNGGRRSGSGTGSFANKVAPEPISGSLPTGYSPLG